MAETLYRCQMAYQHESSDKVWGAVVLKHTGGADSGYYQYASAWGRRGFHISSKLQKPEHSGTIAMQRYAKATREKVSEGYLLVAADYDLWLQLVLDNITLDQKMVDKAIEKATTVTPQEKNAKPIRQEIPRPDLPCTASTCGHWLNVHATLEPGMPQHRLCLVSTCQCEQYRRLCDECGFTSVNVWMHQTTCITGQKEKHLPKPEEDKSITPATPTTIYVRQPRRIMHLISDD